MCADIYSPLKEDETVDETVVNIMYPFEDESKPPVPNHYLHACLWPVLEPWTNSLNHALLPDHSAIRQIVNSAVRQISTSCLVFLVVWSKMCSVVTWWKRIFSVISVTVVNFWMVHTPGCVRVWLAVRWVRCKTHILIFSLTPEK